MPQNTKIYNVTIEQLKSGKFIDSEGKEVLVKDLYIYDIGEESRKWFEKRIMATPKGMAVFYNGTIGVDEIKELSYGSEAICQALANATEKGVITVFGGGDTVASAENHKVDEKVTHCSTGGGASLAMLQGKELKVITKLKEISKKNTRKHFITIVTAMLSVLLLGSGVSWSGTPGVVGSDVVGVVATVVNASVIGWFLGAFGPTRGFIG